MAPTGLYKKAISTGIFVALTALALVVISTLHDNTKNIFADTPMTANVFDTSVKIIRIILGMLLVIAVVRFVAFLLMSAAARRSAQTEVLSLLKTVFSIIVYIIGFLVIFQTQYSDVSLAPLFTGSTILGIVVGLALQDTLGNLFAGIALQADAPFQVGDVVSINNRGSGVVESVSWRGVKIRTFQNKLLVISNSVLGKETMEVAPKNNLNARIVFFSTQYTDSPANTAHLVREAMRQADNVSQKMRPVVRIRDFGADGIDWEVKYWLEDYKKYSDTDAMVRERIWYAFTREKLQFPSPSRTVFVEQKSPEIAFEERTNIKIEILKHVPIFDPLSDEEIERLASGSKRRVYAPGEAIVHKGQEGGSMFVVTRGSVKVQIPEKGYQKTLNTLHENDFFGEMSLLTGEPRSANVIAVTETEVLQIRKVGLKPILEHNPRLVQSISESIEERKALLNTASTTDDDEKGAPQKGVLQSIKKFFSLK